MANGTVRCIDDEIPFEIPQGWEWVKMKSIAFVTKLAGFEYTEYIAPNLKTFGIPLFKGKNIQDGEIIYEFEGYISEELSNSLERSQIRRKCLLTPYVGTIGNVGLHYKEGVFHLGSNVGKIEILNSSSTWITEEYIHLYLTSITGYNELSKHKKATAQESISIEAIRDVYVPIPPKSIQNKIVAIYERVSPLLSLYIRLKRSIDDLNSSVFDLLKKSILQEAIQGRLVPQIESEGTAEELLIDIRAEKNRLVKEGKLKKSAIANESRIFRGDDNKYYEQIDSKIINIDDQIPFDIPDSWCWIRLGELCQLTMGKTPPRGDQEYWRNPVYQWVSISDMVDGGVINKTKEYVSEIAADKIFSAPMSPKGSLLMSFKLTIGKISILGTDAYHNEAIVTILPFKSDIRIKNLLFIFLPILSQQGESKDAIKGKTLNSKSLYNILIPLPPLQEQQRILCQINQLKSHII